MHKWAFIYVNVCISEKRDKMLRKDIKQLPAYCFVVIDPCSLLDRDVMTSLNTQKSQLLILA